MSFRVNTNAAPQLSLEYLRSTAKTQVQRHKATVSRVSSGLRNIASGDVAAGLAIAHGSRRDLAMLLHGLRNARDGLRAMQIPDGGVHNVSGLLDRTRTLAAPSASGTFRGAVANDKEGSPPFSARSIAGRRRVASPRP